MVIAKRTISVLARPNARVTRIIGERDGALVIDIAAKAESGKANEELERFLTKHFGTAAKVISGFSAKKKLVRVG